MSDEQHACPQCPESFSSSRGLASHLKIHRQSVRCPVCDKEVRYLATHVKREHSEDPLVKLELGLQEVIAEVRTLRREVADLRPKIAEAP